MGRSFSFSRAWEANARHIERTQGGIYRGEVERLPQDLQTIRDEDRGGEVVRTRMRRQDSAIGLDSQTFHHSGEEVVILSEEPEIVGGRPTGDILTTYMALGTDDRPRTYEQRWEKTGEGQHTARKPRRVFY